MQLADRTLNEEKILYWQNQHYGWYISETELIHREFDLEQPNMNYAKKSMGSNIFLHILLINLNILEI